MLPGGLSDELTSFGSFVPQTLVMLALLKAFLIELLIFLNPNDGNLSPEESSCDRYDGLFGGSGEVLQHKSKI